MPMQSLRKEDWRYAFLLVVLFAIAALATQAVINYMIPLTSDDERFVVIIMLCALTLGLMLISGAFALWAINFEAKTASMRQLGNLVNSMTYIKDGVLAVNKKSKITGMNPAAEMLFNTDHNKSCTLSDLCKKLTDNEIKRLLKSPNPEEIEFECECVGSTHTLRFRSQPSKDMTLILINDVTKLADIRTRRRHAAYLQLIGHIAQGVANDFNNILCGISGHASLIMHPSSDASIIRQSAESINESSNRGIQLAGRLLELSNSSQTPLAATIQPSNNINIAIDAIAADLHSSWQITRNIDNDIPPTNLTGAQIEHITHGLGMLATDLYNKERKLYIQLSPPTAAGLCHAKNDYAGIVIITTANINTIEKASIKSRTAGSAGTIESVVSSILKQSGGQLDCFNTSSGIPVYRICLPHATTDQLRSQQENLPLGLEAYIANWNVLLCKDKHSSKKTQHYLESCKVNTEYTNNIVDTLARIEHGSDLHAIIINSATLGEEREGLLRAITKLCPQAGLVIINKTAEAIDSLASDAVFIPQSYSPAQIAQAMIEARTLARSRQKQ
jgi:nitrogen-specific signal transduction histidine kinase